MNIADILDPGCVRAHIHANDRDEALSSIAGLLASVERLRSVSSPDRIGSALTERERIGSTGFGNGIAIPHCRLEGADGFATGLVTLDNPIDFGAVDDRPVDVLAFVAGPSDRPREHVALLSVVARAFRNQDFCASLREAANDTALLTIIRSALAESALPALPLAPPTARKLIHVFVSNEELFERVLQSFQAEESISSLVIETIPSREYMAHIPLLAGFWDSADQLFSRMIMAVVREELVNATIRQIEYACGDISGRDDLLVTVTDVIYSTGSLDGSA